MNSDLYKQIIIDHYKAPRNIGRISGASSTCDVKNVSCGDEVTVDITVSKSGILEDVKYEANGCAISIAGMSLLSEKIIGKKLSEVEKITSKKMLEMLGMKEDSGRVKCALLGLEAVKKAIKKLRDK